MDYFHMHHPAKGLVSIREVNITDIPNQHMQPVLDIM